jgi:nitrogen fixation NifU-like protein
MTEQRHDEQESELDRIVANIAEMLAEQDSETYSPKVIREFRNPSNLAHMDDPDGQGISDGLCGDTMMVYLKIEDGMISRCTFETDGCGATVACGSMLTRIAEGLSLENATGIDPEQLLSALDGLPDGHRHCATLAVIALKNAVRDFVKRQAADAEEGG